MLAIVDNGTSFLKELRGVLDQLGLAYDLLAGNEELSPEALNSYTGAILTGGRVHVYESDRLAEIALNTRFLVEGAVPLLGLCLGHQIIAQHFGGTVEPLPEPINQYTSVELIDPKDPLFAGLPDRITVRMAHGDEVAKLSGSLMRLARSPFGENEAIRHVSLPVYGLQFHPETNFDVGLTVLKNFADLCSDVYQLDPG